MASWSNYKNGSELPDTYAFAIHQKLSAGDTTDLELFSQWIAKIINEESQVRSYEMENVGTGAMKYVLFVQVESYNDDGVYFLGGTKLIGINAVTAHKYLWKYQKTKKSRYGNYGPEGAVVRDKSASDPAAMGLDPAASSSSTEKVSGASQADPNDVEYAKQHKQDTAHGTDLDSDREVSASDTSTGLTVEQYITQALGPTAATACFAEDKTDYSASSNTSVTSGTSVTPSGTSVTPSGGDMPTDIGGATDSDQTTDNGSLSFSINNDRGSLTYLLYDTVTTSSYSKTDTQEKRYAIPSGVLDSTYEATFGTATKCYAYEGKADAIRSLTQLKQQAFQQITSDTNMSQEQKENTAKVNNALYNGLIESVQALKEHWQCRMQVTVSNDTRYLIITTYYGYYNPTETSSTVTTETTVDTSQPLKYEKEETKAWQYDIPPNTLAVTFEKVFGNNDKCFDFRAKADELALFDQMAVTFEEEMNASPGFGEEQRQNMITAYKTMYSGCKVAVEYLKEHWQCRIKCTVSADTSKMIVTGYYGYYNPATATSGSGETSSETVLVKPIPPSIIMGIALAKTGTGEEDKTTGKHNIWNLDYDKDLTTQVEVDGKCSFSSLKEAIEGILKWCHKQSGADQLLTTSIEKDSEDAKVTVTNNYLKMLDGTTSNISQIAVAKLVQAYNLREWDHHSKVGAATATPSSAKNNTNKIGVGVKRIVIGEAHAGDIIRLIKLPENLTNPAEPIYPDYVTIADSIPQWIITQAQAEISKKAEQDALAAAGITDKQAQTEAAIDVLQQEMDQFREDQFSKWAQAEGEDISDETSLQAAKAKYNQLAARGEEGFHNGVYCPDSEDVNKWDIMNLKLRNLRNTSANIAAQNDAWSSEATKAAAAIYEREKDWNQEVGVPVELVDESTYQVSTGSTTITSGSAGAQSVIDGAVAWALKIANDEDGQTHGYSQANRNGPDYDCTSFVSWAYKTGGGLSDLFTDNNTPNGNSFYQPFENKGFKYMTYKEAGGKNGLKKGDIVCNSSHVEIFVGNGKLCGAHSSKTNKADEISVINFYENWTHVLRYNIATSSSGGNIQTSSDLTPPQGVAGVVFECTAYCPGIDVEMQGTGVTAWGSIPCEGKTINAHYIAVDPDVISYGSVVYIQFTGDFSYLSGEYVAVDTGGAIIGHRLDLYAGMGTVPGIYDFCMRFGRRNAVVFFTGKKITVEQAQRWRNPM